jgi:hypothetical protein
LKKSFINITIRVGNFHCTKFLILYLYNYIISVQDRLLLAYLACLEKFAAAKLLCIVGVDARLAGVITNRLSSLGFRHVPIGDINSARASGQYVICFANNFREIDVVSSMNGTFIYVGDAPCDRLPGSFTTSGNSDTKTVNYIIKIANNLMGKSMMVGPS